MVIKIINRSTDTVVFELDVNDEGNRHELHLENRGAEIEISGESYAPAFVIRTVHRQTPSVTPLDCRTLRLESK